MKTATELQKEVRKMVRAWRKEEITYEVWDGFVDRIKEEYGSQAEEAFRFVYDHMEVVRKRLNDYLQSPAYRFKIRKYCNLHLYTDIEPNEVIEVISPKKVRIRRMTATIKVAPKDFHQGGFCGHFSDNYSQQWDCISDPEAETEVLTLTKKGWGTTGSHGMYRMNDNPRKFYDYNF